MYANSKIYVNYCFNRAVIAKFAKMTHIKTKRQCRVIIEKPLIWLNNNAFVSKAVGFRYKSRTGQIKYIANSAPPLRHFFEKSCIPLIRNDGDMGSAKLVTRFHVIQRVQ